MDGNKVYQSTATLLDVDMGLGEQDTFETLLIGKTDTEVPDAWGGYFDAADWDRRIQHLAVPRSLLELHNLFPEYLRTVNLNLPESTNTLPDILDEALWSIDFFRRLQTSDGGIRGGVESAAHPKKGETSWQESQLVMAYTPDVWSSYMYAGVAARAALALSAYDAVLADTYQSSALAAMAYAERNYEPERYTEGKKLHHVADQRNLAALELYRLTKDPAWHELFLSTTVFQSDTVNAYTHSKHDQREVAFLYARLNEATVTVDSVTADSAASTFTTVPTVDSSVQSNARNAFLRRADNLARLTRTTAFGWSRQQPTAPMGWRNGLGAPTATDFLRAHALTDQADYLNAWLSGTQFAAGANPDNMVFTTGLGTGLGARSPQNPLISSQANLHHRASPSSVLLIFATTATIGR